MKQPEKWKETINPFDIKFNKFKLLEVLGYPHARNDVFYVKGVFENKEVFAFIKYASKKDSDILHEVETINKLNYNFLPNILDYDKNEKWCVTKEIDGERLSNILNENKNKNAFDYMFEYGKTLALIHTTNINTKEVKHRKFFDILNLEYFKENDLEFVYYYLIENKPTNINKCFCHGDFHYANILWNNNKISAVLDWELSGLGNKEFDIAWAIINRPGQKFLKTKKEGIEFLKGYDSLNYCDKKLVEYYMILIYSHFLNIDKNNEKYKNFVKSVFKKTIK